MKCTSKVIKKNLKPNFRGLLIGHYTCPFIGHLSLTTFLLSLHADSIVQGPCIQQQRVNIYFQNIEWLCALLGYSVTSIPAAQTYLIDYKKSKQNKVFMTVISPESYPFTSKMSYQNHHIKFTNMKHHNYVILLILVFSNKWLMRWCIF